MVNAEAKKKITKLRKRRNPLKTDTDEVMDRYNNLDPQDPNLQHELMMISNVLKDNRSKLDVIHEELCDLMDGDSADFDQEVDESSQFDKQVLKMISEAEVRLAQITLNQVAPAAVPAAVAPAAIPAPTHAADELAKLPKLSVPTFGGDPLKWHAFWDIFESSVHNRTTLSDNQKLQYLKGYLVKDAEAFVDGYRVSRENYAIVVDQLKKKYGDTDAVVQAHLDEFDALTLPSSDFKALQRIHEESERHIRSLLALNVSEETLNLFFTRMILRKLPYSVGVHLRRYHSDGAWNLKYLRDAIATELAIRQDAQRYSGADDKKPAVSSEQKTDKSYSNTSSGHGHNNQYAHNKGSWKKSGGQFRPTQGTLMKHHRPEPACAFCKGKHYNTDCPKFTTAATRKLSLTGHCFQCLGTDHFRSQCRSKKQCYYCGAWQHHSSLCDQQFPNTSPGSGSSRQGQQGSGKQQAANSGSNGTKMINTTKPHRVQMQMAVVKMDTHKGNELKVRVLLDSGCSRTYITRTVMRELNLPKKGDKVLVSSTFNATTPVTEKHDWTDIQLPTKDGSMEFTALVSEHITTPIHKYGVSIVENPILAQVELADDLSPATEEVKIDMVIGQDYFYDVVGTERIVLHNGMYLVSSKFGYIVTGRVPRDNNNDNNCHNLANLSVACFNSTVAPEDLVNRMWDLDYIGIKDDPYGCDDEKALERFNSTIKKNDVGRYEVTWPYRDEAPDLATNKGLAYGCLVSLLKRLKGQPAVLKEYDRILKEQLTTGITEDVTNVPPQGQEHYLAHHSVLREDKSTTKVRIVFNASAKMGKSSRSLNECLLRGPVLLRNLVGILMRFRKDKIAITADVEKAFLQVGLQPSERDITRFLWVKDTSKPPSGNNLVTLRFARTCFGIISSPFLLEATILFHLSTKKSDTATAISRNTYVDNVICTQPTVDKAEAYYKETKSIFEELSMNIREWYSNSTEFMQRIEGGDVGKDSQPKVLGLSWNMERDALSCSGFKNLCGDNPTKRSLLKSVATLYDPCGWFGPVLVPARLLIQDLWRDKIDWDTALQLQHKIQGIQACDEMAKIESVPVTRYLGQVNPTAKYQLHCFTDASKHAYGAAVYLRSTTPKGSTCKLLYSKFRLAPIKTISIPRLELLGVVIGARMLKFVNEELDLNIDQTFLWTDSACVLSWLSTSRLLTTFVHNRIRELREHDNLQFRYVPTKLNPADIVSRGSTCDELSSSDLWWQGPSYLLLKEKMWPENKFDSLKDLPEQRLTVQLLRPVAPIADITTVMEINRFASLTTLLKATAYVFRLAKRQPKPNLRVQIAELRQANMVWIKAIQAPFLESLQTQRLSKGLKALPAPFRGS